MNENIFWELIEYCWEPFNMDETRRLAISKPTPQVLQSLSEVLNNQIILLLDEELDKLSKEDLLLFDQILERKLYDIDREELYEVIEGGEDLFLYRRGFIVGIGKAYYEAINNNPSIANDNGAFRWDDAHTFCEDICFNPIYIYKNKFDENVRIPPTGISRESGSNEDKWSY